MPLTLSFTLSPYQLYKAILGPSRVYVSALFSKRRRKRNRTPSRHQPFKTMLHLSNRNQKRKSQPPQGLKPWPELRLRFLLRRGRRPPGQPQLQRVCYDLYLYNTACFLSNRFVLSAVGGARPKTTPTPTRAPAPAATSTRTSTLATTKKVVQSKENVSSGTQAAPKPAVKNVQSKIGSLDYAAHKPGQPSECLISS